MRSLEDILIKMNFCLKDLKPFVIYSKPCETLVCSMFQNDRALYSPDFTESGFIIAPFSGIQKILIPESKSEIMKCEVQPATDCEDPDLIQPDINLNAESKDSFIALVKKSIEVIHSGEINKVVVSRKIDVNLNGFDLSAVIKTLFETNQTAFRYCFYHPQAGLWIGATPERFLNVKGNKINTVSLAGTQKYHGSEDVDWKEKEKLEQQFVTGFIVSSLTPFTSKLQSSAPFTQRAGNLLHIKTEIDGVLKDDSEISGIINILHPTPAVCGLPKDAAMHFILENEDYNREYYSGYLGELNIEDSTDLYVNLRCMQIKDNTAHIYVGCGITKDSNAESEFAETANKSMTMRKILINTI